MPVRSFTRRPIHVWIPPLHYPVWKFTVTRDDGTIDDITQILSMLEIEDNVTDSIGKFTFKIWNPNNTYTGVWNGKEIVKFYMDYATSATTLRFRGEIEKINREGNNLRCIGRSSAVFFLTKTVTKQYASNTCDSILKDLVSSYGGGNFTTTNINVSTTFLSVNWYQKPFFECVKELCDASGFDAYVDANLDWHFFEKGSVQNSGEAIVHEHNLIEVEEFGDDIQEVRNRIIIYGAERDGIQIIYTAEDSTSQTNYGVKELIINDDNITTYDQAVDVGDFILSTRKDPPQTGNMKSGILLATIQPGEQIRLSSPDDDIPPAMYTTTGYKHIIDNERGTYTTSVEVNKEVQRISHVIRDIIERDNQKKRTSINPYEMRYSFNFTFDSDSGTHTNTEVTNGVLKLQSGQSSGNWVSEPRTVASNGTNAYLIMVGETLTGATVSVTFNNGTDYQVINNKDTISITSAKGTTLRVKVEFNNADTQIDSLSLQYKLE